ncbi:hypothetical protein ACFOW4_00065 [Micromonospora sp. GCM10011542]|uniref:hypothetical protein n=1 Tax=Micromonospora sp. GCM10011542 TaxID=3317337 RepID=UPI003605ED43
MGLAGFHFHDLRHTGNTLAASAGASTRELMHRMGHATMRAALIYQHATSERDREIAGAMDRRIAGEADANGEWHADARKIQNGEKRSGPGAAIMRSAWAFVVGAGDGNRTRTVSLEGRRSLPRDAPNACWRKGSGPRLVPARARPGYRLLARGWHAAAI